MKHVEVIDFSLRCETRLDRCDAFVTIRAIDDEARQDIAGNLADMYLNWANRMGFASGGFRLREPLFGFRIPPLNFSAQAWTDRRRAQRWRP